MATHRFSRVWWLIIVITLSHLNLEAHSEPPSIGEKVPGWSAVTTSGKKVDFLSEIQDRPAILVFWASWCPYCKGLLPKLATVHSKFESIPVYSVNFASDDNPAKNPFAYSKFENIWNGDDIATSYQVEIVPTVFLIENQRVVYRLEHPPEDHPSNDKDLSKSKQIKLLAEWWEIQLNNQISKALK